MGNAVYPEGNSPSLRSISTTFSYKSYYDNETDINPTEESDGSDSESEDHNKSNNSQIIIHSDTDANYRLLDMPNEILCLLVSQLQSKNDIRALMLTSKAFTEIVYFSWSSLSLKCDNKLTYHQFLSLPADRLQYLIELDISHCSKMTNALFNQIMDKTPNLQVLKMKGCSRLTRSAFSKLSKYFTKFTSLDMRLCNTEEMNNVLFPYNPNLKQLGVCPNFLMDYRFRFKIDALTITHLNLKSNANIVNGYIEMRHLEQFANLVTFKGTVHTAVFGLNDYDFTAFKDLENLTLLNEVKTLKLAAPQKLKRLSFMPLDFDSTAFTDMSNLISLKLKPWPRKEPSPVKNFTLALFPKLEVLVAEFEVKTDEELAERQSLVKLDVPFKTKQDAIDTIYALPNLSSFTYRGLIDKKLFRAIRSLKKLEHLQIKGILATAKELDWRSFKTLQSLYVSDLSYRRVAHFEQLKQIPKLQKLRIRNTDGIILDCSDPEHVRIFCKHFEGFPSLKVLIIRDDRYEFSIREDTLMNIKGLTYVSLSCEK